MNAHRSHAHWPCLGGGVEGQAVAQLERLGGSADGRRAAWQARCVAGTLAACRRSGHHLSPARLPSPPLPRRLCSAGDDCLGRPSLRGHLLGRGPAQWGDHLDGGRAEHLRTHLQHERLVSAPAACPGSHAAARQLPAQPCASGCARTGLDAGLLSRLASWACPRALAHCAGCRACPCSLGMFNCMTVMPVAGGERLVRRPSPACPAHGSRSACSAQAGAGACAQPR